MCGGLHPRTMFSSFKLSMQNFRQNNSVTSTTFAARSKIFRGSPCGVSIAMGVPQYRWFIRENPSING